MNRGPLWDIGTIQYPHLPPMLRVQRGRTVLIEAPTRDRIEVYQRDRAGLERWKGYLDEQPQRDRARLAKTWMRGWIRARAGGARR